MSSPHAAPASKQPRNPESIPPQERSLSPEWIHAITTLMGHPMSSEFGQKIRKYVFHQGIHDYTDLVITWDPTELGENRNLQKYEESDGFITPLQSNTVKQLISLINYMLHLICQERPTDQMFNAFYYLLGEQWFNLTAHDMKSTLVNSVLDNHRSQQPQEHLCPW